MNQITLVPTAGLCNRINAISSAMYLYRSCPIPFEIYWEKSKGCCAYFTDLFEPIEGFNIYPLTRFYLKPGSRKNLFLPDFFRKFHFDACYRGHEISDMDFCSLIKGKERIYVTSSNRFCQGEETKSLHRYFVPIKELSNKIKTITDSYPNNTIGVHVRRTDNIDAIKNNPIEYFYSQMDMEIAKHKDTCFYLATDSIKVKTEMTKRYSGKIISQNLSLSRNNVKGMQDAVIDLYCLATTKKIIGCTDSTYSIVASRLFNAVLQTNNMQI